MLDMEYKLLSYVKENQPCSWVDVLNAVRHDSDDVDVNTLHALLSCCLSPHGWIEKTSKADRPPLCHVRLTPSGETALLTASETLRKKAAEQAQQYANKQAAETKRLKERDEDRADEERHHRTQNQIAVIMPIFMFVLGLIAEHFTGIVAAVISFFQ